MKNHATTVNEKFDPIRNFPVNWNISDGINEDVIQFSENFGKYLCALEKNKYGESSPDNRKALTNSQIRNFFGEVKRIQMTLTGNVNNERWIKVKASFLLLKPKLAYATGRAKTKNKMTRMIDFMEVIIKVINMVEADKPGAAKRFMHFVDFFESILAFHKAYGGKEN